MDPVGTLGCLPDEILCLILFGHCHDAVSNQTISLLSTHWRQFVSKYAQGPKRLESILLRAGVAFTRNSAMLPLFLRDDTGSLAFSWDTCAQLGRFLPFLRGPLRRPAARTDRPGRGDYGNVGRRRLCDLQGSVTFRLPRVPEAVYRHLATTQARIELRRFTPHVPDVDSSTSWRPYRDAWWDTLVEQLQAQAVAAGDLSRDESRAIHQLYEDMRANFDLTAGPGVTRFILVVSMPLLGAPVNGPEPVHLFIPVAATTADPVTSEAKRCGLVVDGGGRVRLQTKRHYRLLFRTRHLGRVEGWIEPKVTTFELTRPEDLAADADANTARIARLKDDFKRHRERSLTPAARTERAGERILVHVAFLRRAFAELAAAVCADFPDPDDSDLDEADREQLGWIPNGAGPVLAEFTVNQLKSPVDRCNSWEKAAAVLYVFTSVVPQKAVRKAADALCRVCGDLRVFLVGGRYELVVNFGEWRPGCPIGLIQFQVVLDGTTLVFLDDDYAVARTAKVFPPDGFYLRTGNIRSRPWPRYNVAERVWSEVAEADGYGAG